MVFLGFNRNSIIFEKQTRSMNFNLINFLDFYEMDKSLNKSFQREEKTGLDA